MVFGEEADGLLVEGETHTADDYFQVREGPGDLVEEEGAGVFEKTSRSDGGIVEKDRQVQLLSGFVKLHRFCLGGMKRGLGTIKDYAFEAEFFGGGFKIADAEAFSKGIDKGEADHFVFVPSDVLAQIFVDLVGGPVHRNGLAIPIREVSLTGLLTT